MPDCKNVWNGEDEIVFGVLVRGLYLDISGCPWVVVPDPGKGGVPRQALTVDIASVLVDGAPDEEAAAKLLREAFDAWEFDKAPAGLDAIMQSDRMVAAPACVAIKNREALAGLYWVGRDLESARLRLEKQDDSLLEISPAEPARVVNAAERADVVRGRIALVTGGAQGIGEEIVRSLAASGALVFIADLNLEGASKLADSVNASENRLAALPAAVNVSDEGSVAALFRAIALSAGGLDLCISNAGVLKAGSVLEQPLKDFQFTTDVNYTGFFLAAKYAGLLMRCQFRTAPRWKTDIIQINSKSGLEGSKKNGAYAGGKFGGIGLVESFALELVEYNIKVNAICPGNFLDGPLWSDPRKGLFVQYLEAGKVPGAKTVEDVRAFYEAKVPMRRGCTGADLSRAIYYIVEQEYETGQAVPVTGGQTMLH
ncbi:MAG: SDR family NAD(P)-dependent oxidoreductase [Spirochaetaceae bacterium]|jgi:sorbitol-6-phosphate 2-dehydrogenase|nr:SDR family NAD(P)-dependent oxidoreductase [Spirochaetaceae bacterium]